MSASDLSVISASDRELRFVDLAADLAVELAGIRRRAEQLTGDHNPDGCDLNGETCTGHDAERLLEAVEQVIRYHTTPGVRRRKGALVCPCDSELMPCLQLQAIGRALIGEPGGAA
jgi:hypothetical protein